MAMLPRSKPETAVLFNSAWPDLPSESRHSGQAEVKFVELPALTGGRAELVGK